MRHFNHLLLTRMKHLQNIIIVLTLMIQLYVLWLLWNQEILIRYALTH